jgi:hypothetical protein
VIETWRETHTHKRKRQRERQTEREVKRSRETDRQTIEVIGAFDARALFGSEGGEAVTHSIHH